MTHRIHPLLFLICAALSSSLAVLTVAAPLVRAETTAPKAGEPQANDARLAGDSNRTRFIADISKDVQFTVRTLADPYRIIVDLDEVNLQMPEGLGGKGRGLVRAFRFGAFAAGKSRIVIDTTDPVLVEKAFIRPAGEKQPARLVVDMMRTTRAEFLKASQQQAATAQQKKSAGDAKPRAETAVASTGWAAKTAIGDEKSQPSHGGKPVVVIDPGHGGIDPGTRGASGMLEKAVVLAFCGELKQKLEASGRFNVIMTRETDDFIALNERVDLARARNAALLISIHADAIDANHPLLGAKGPEIAQTVRGATVYTLDQNASDAEAQASASRENRSDIMAGIEGRGDQDDESKKVLGDLLQRAAKNESREFANILVDHLSGKIELNLKPKRAANFTVLRAAEFPSVLLELGYLSNHEDERLLLPPISNKISGVIASCDALRPRWDGCF
jgi:N-acetylmuramoyl-L-alanine amidase